MAGTPIEPTAEQLEIQKQMREAMAGGRTTLGPLPEISDAVVVNGEAYRVVPAAPADTPDGRTLFGQPIPAGSPPIATWRMARAACLVNIRLQLCRVVNWRTPFFARFQALRFAFDGGLKAISFTRLIRRARRDPTAPYARCYAPTCILEPAPARGYL